MQIDFSAAFDSYQGILYKLCSVGIGGSVSYILIQFLYQTNYSTLWWMAIGVNWLTLCQECRGDVFWVRYCSSSTLRSLFPFWKISLSVMLMTTLMAVVPSPGVRVTVAESMILDLGRVSEWCDLW